MYIKRFKWSPAAALLITLGLVGCNSDDVKTNSDFDAIDPTAPVSDWQLVWSDEFDGDFIDENKWNFEIDCWGGGNNEQQCYTDNPENAYVSDGTLKIVALPADGEATNPYTSARLTSKNKGDFKYGRIEVRARMPHGQGSWPAVWMMPTDDVYGGWPRSGEIDIVEAVNLGVEDADGQPETRVYGTLHYGRVWPDNDESGKEYTLPNGANPADDFNTYAIEWQEGEIRWYVNDYLYQTQMQSLVRVNSNNQPIGLRHRGWYVETFNQVTGELETVYSAAPFDQRFHLIMNLAVGGNWPENVNNLGIDADAFAEGQVFEIDYVRVYECSTNPQTGRGCDTIRAGYKDEETLVTGHAPIPVPPSDGVARNLTIFAGTPNPDWPAWDCCAGSTPELVEDDDLGSVYRFVIGSEPTVNGFITRSEFIDDEGEGTPSPFDASPLLETGSISFDLKVVSQPNDSSSVWLFKVESNGGRSEVEGPISNSIEGENPATGVWQRVTFPLQYLADLDLDLSAIDALMVFPAWGTGDGAEYLITNVMISAPSPELVLFADDINPDWSLWDCCGGTDPSVVADPDRGNVAEFQVGATEAVLGFLAADDVQFDASALMAEGVLQFDMKVVAAPADPNSVWKVKVESDGASSEAEVDLITGNGGMEPVTGEWATYTFPLQELSDIGLDLAAIDVVMIFPAWGTGNGAIYHIDEARIYNPSSGASALSVFRSGMVSGWSAASTSSLINDSGATTVSQFEIFDETATNTAFFAENDMAIDATRFLANGAISFDLRIISLPDDTTAAWVFRVESANGLTDVELPLSAGHVSADNGSAAPVAGEWVRYSFPLTTLRKAGLDISSISAIQVSPESGKGRGAIYQVNNLDIANF